jgi:predicted amidohydrolase
MATDRLRIGIAQSLITPDVRINGAHIRALLRRACDAGARLVHFPECALSGYTKSQIRDWARVDWAALREELGETIALAGALGVWVVLGSAHRLTAPHRPHNSLYVISDAGRLVARYDKRRCSHTEVTRFFTPGVEPLVFAVDGFSFGCALCIELCFPELFLEYERLAVDCLLFSSYSEDLTYGVVAQAHAATNNYWVSFSVPAQCAHAVPASLIGPDGSVVARGAHVAGVDLVVADLDRTAPEFDVALTKARPWRATARQGAIYASRWVDDPRSRDRSCY